MPKDAMLYSDCCQWLKLMQEKHGQKQCDILRTLFWRPRMTLDKKKSFGITAKLLQNLVEVTKRFDPDIKFFLTLLHVIKFVELRITETAFFVPRQ